MIALPLLLLSLFTYAGKFEEPIWKSNCRVNKETFQLVFKSKSGDAAEDDMSAQIDFSNGSVPLELPPALYTHFDRTKNGVCDNLPVIQDNGILYIFFLQDERPTFDRLNVIALDVKSKKVISLHKDLGQVHDTKWTHSGNQIRLNLIHGWKIERNGSDGPDIIFTDWRKYSVKNGKLKTSWEKKVPAAFASQEIISSSLQLITVRTTGWNTFDSTVRIYERPSVKAEWKLKTSFPAVIGRNGFAWGSGAFLSQSGTQKKEGDGKAPAGVFTLGNAHGYENRKTKLSFILSTDDLECVDDGNSTFYNQVVDRTKLKPDWNGHEEMKRKDDLYKYVIEVQHNRMNTKEGGSCIFLHIWKNAQSGTAGCTAMDEMQMKDLLSWIDPKKNPALVQMPDPEYERLKFSWEMPE